MTTVRGYEWGEATPRHEVQKRTYRDCTGCGCRTWSPRGLCANCSGRAEYHRSVIINGHTKAAASKERARKIYHLLHTTNKPQIDIAAEIGVTAKLVSQIRTGRVHVDVTGGYVTRPYERGDFSNMPAADNQLVQKIYDCLKNTNTKQANIAQQFNVSRSYISSIRCGTTGTKITGGYVLRPYERES